jgi:hypothetical protein
MRTLVVALVIALTLGSGPVTAAGQESATPESSPIEEVTTIAPGAETTTEAPTDTTPDTTTAPTDEAAEEEQQAEVDAGDRPAWQAPGFGDAAARSTEAKVAEAVNDCTSERDPVSRMLAVGGTSEGGGNRAWVVLAIAIAAGALLVAGIAFVVRSRRGRREGHTPAPRGPLETVATILGIVSGVFGLAFVVAPDLAPDKSSSRTATMTVREVDARIRHGEYVTKTGSEVPLKRIDRSEVGNVVWLEIGLQGYEGKEPVVQYGLHDPGRGGALIDGTERQVRLRRPASQDETLFVPIWVGYPQTGRFEAHFRLVEDDEVREIASTGRMRASQYRYACDTYVRRLAEGG